MRSPSGRRGLTLIEVMVSLVVTGSVVVLGRGVFDQLVRSKGSIRQAAIERAARRNAGRWLAETVEGATVAEPGDAPFEGSPTRMQFDSWMLGRDGWHERRHVSIGLEGDRVIATAGGAEVVLWEEVSKWSLQYAPGPIDRARWSSVWPSQASLPVAVRVIRASVNGSADTLVLAVKDRR